MDDNSEFYNIDRKNKFLNSRSKGQGSYITLFKKSAEVEREYNKDISEMPRELVIKFIAGLTHEVAMSYLSLVNKYREYSTGTKDVVSIKEISLFRDQNKDPFRRDIVKGLLSKDRFYDLVSNLESKQCALFHLLAFEGIGFKTDMKETLELEYSDLDFENKRIFIKSRNEFVSVTKKLLDFIEESYNEEYIYVMKDYNTTKKTKSLKSKFLVRRYLSDKIQDKAMTRSSCQKRFDYFNYKFKDILNGNNFTIMDSKMSGVFYYILCIDKYSQITNLNLLKVFKRFGLSPNKKYDVLNGLGFYKREILNNIPIEINSDVKTVLDSILSTSITQKELKDIEKVKGKFHETDQDEFDNIVEKENKHKSDWVSENIEKGFVGEKYVYDLLINKFGESNVKNPKDSYGYDIAVKVPNLYLEVKTTNTCNPSFIISRTELYKAKKLGDKYYITLVLVDLVDSKYTVEDIRILNINTEEFDTCFIYLDSNEGTEKSVLIECDSVKISLNHEVLDKYEKFEELFSKFQ